MSHLASFASLTCVRPLHYKLAALGAATEAGKRHCNLTCRWSVAAAMTSTSPSMSMLLLVSSDACLCARSIPLHLTPPFSRVGTLCWHTNSTCAYARLSWRRTPLDGARHREQRLERATTRQWSRFVLYSDESAESRSRTVSGWLQLASLAAVYSALCACRVLQTSMAFVPGPIVILLLRWGV